MDNKLYEDFNKYLKILDRIDVATENNEILSFSPEEREVVRRVQVAAGNNSELGELLGKIKESSSAERAKVVDDFFNSNSNSKNEEDEIAKVYGVDPRNINFKRLNSGKEIFSFFDFKLNRLVVLENNKNGKSLVEYLEEIQNENEQYQSTDDLSNANSIMDDQRKKTSMELPMISLNEIGNHQAEVAELSNEDKQKLQFLISNADQLGVRMINIENLIYSDADNNIKEVVFDKDRKVAVADPESEEFEKETTGPEVTGGETTPVSDELDAMFETPSTDDLIANVSPAKYAMFEDLDESSKNAVIAAYEDRSILDGIQDPKTKQNLENKIALYQNYLERTNQKPKVFTKVDNSPVTPQVEQLDEAGMVNNIIFVLLMSLVFVGLIIEIIYFM